MPSVTADAAATAPAATRRASAAYPVLDLTPKNLARALGVALATVASAAASLAVGSIIDALAAGEDVTLRLAASLAVAMLAAAATVLLGAWVPRWAGVSRAMGAAVSAVRQLLSAPSRAVARHDKGYYVNALTGSTETYGAMYADLNVSVLGSGLALAALVAVAAAQDVLLAAMLLVYVPVFALALRLPARRLARLQGEGIPAQDAWLGESKRIVEEKRSINASASEGFFSARYRERSAGYLAFITRYRFNAALIDELPTVLSCVLAAAMMAAEVWRASAGLAGAGQVFVAYQIAQLAQGPLSTLLSKLANVRGNRVHAERLAELAAASEEPSGFEGLRGAGGDGGEKDDGADVVVRIDGTLWATPERGEGGRRLWETHDLTIRRGELVVLLGANGSGKSMLLDFLRGLSDPDDLDGTAELAPELAHAAYLTYPVPVVTGDLAYNLLGGTADPEVARVLDVSGFAGKQIDGSTVNLSLGERQKLGLLRALSRPEPVVLLDEPLTNLDAATSARLCDYLAGLRGRRTVVAIMHSDDLDAAADQILRIEDGVLRRVR
ncbi:ABC transporter ATP-binding protein [Olsenella profusa]|uniref:ABC transporter ATP-binding protein/permease n=1 Tax=Olsenella profusa TaxID=138595 RepID=A0ABS2F2G4_9ACTN|nr:ABC transporter ATP-binding protein [Olsenella profusa]MBM6774758.1 ABC transporter ATP-binding protein/permease [Olsenella profusa]